MERVGRGGGRGRPHVEDKMAKSPTDPNTTPHPPTNNTPPNTTHPHTAKENYLPHFYQAVGFLPVDAHVAEGAIDFFF